MKIYPPPIRDSLSPISNNWAIWFDTVFRSLSGGGSAGSVFNATATLDFGSIGAGAMLIKTVTIPGVTLDAANRARVILGWPPTNGIIYDAYVFKLDTVTIRAHNYTSGAIDPASGVFSVTVLYY